MTYCGSIGSVNVLTIMSTDLFDESQENPFLLQGSPSPTKKKLSSPRSPQRGVSFSKGGELPLGDSSSMYSNRTPRGFPGMNSPLRKTSLSSPVSPQSSPGRTVSFAASSSPQRSILKRQSSIESDLSTVSSYRDQQQQQTNRPVVTDSELHKLLYSLNRFGLANDATASPIELTDNFQPAQVNPLWFRGDLSTADLGVMSEGYDSGDEPEDHHSSRSAMAKRRCSNKKMSTCSQDPVGGSRRSVTYSTVKNLLRGGGPAGRTALKNTPDVDRRKSTGTISSRLKVNQKFVRPTIHTDAYHRVSGMKLGTRPLHVHVKHVAFPERWEEDICDREEADPGMPSPKGQLRRDSFISLETLDKIGTRAACPVHLLNEEKADYSRVGARVDSYNHVHSPKRGLRRPSTWLAGAALDARVAYESP